MIFSSGGINAVDNSKYDSSQRIARIQGATKVAAVSAINEMNHLTDEQRQKKQEQHPRESFQDLLEQNRKNDHSAETILKATEEIKLSVLKQVISFTEKMIVKYGENPLQTSMLKTQWFKLLVASDFYPNAILTAFRTNGYALRTDGKNMSFEICVELTDAFCQKYENGVQQNSLISEPAYIKVDHHVNEIANMRFLLDLNDDETESSALPDRALNKNIYHTLKVWMKDINGGSTLVDLKGFDREAAYKRNITDLPGLLEKPIYNNRFKKGEPYDIPGEKSKSKSNIDFSV